MKRFVKAMVVTVVLVALLAVSAFAADFTHCADALKDLGLFQGTSKGYELDRAPNRAEAATMLVRLLGKEAEAKELTYTAPFTDVADWAKPYVQYLYENGLTNGQGNGKFGSTNLCTAQQYATFLLRALGYQDTQNGDFTYANAIAFATEKGVVDAFNCDAANFQRDDIVAMSYTALATAPKSGEADLLTKLVKEGAVKDAKGYDKKFETYRTYCKAAQADANESKMSMTMDMTMDMKASGSSFVTGTVKVDMSADMNLEKLNQSKMAYTMDMDMKLDPKWAESMGASAGDTAMKTTAKCYYTDGAMYMDMMDQKVKMPMSFDDALKQTQTMNIKDTAEPISLIEDITVSGSTYKLTYAPAAFNSLLGSVMNSMTSSVAGAQTADMKFTKLAIDVTVKNGHATAMNMDMGMDMTVSGMVLNTTVTCKVSNVKTGSAVTVTLPTDLSSYKLMENAG